jgi:hypothetical protein
MGSRARGMQGFAIESPWVQLPRHSDSICIAAHPLLRLFLPLVVVRRPVQARGGVALRVRAKIMGSIITFLRSHYLPPHP